MAPSISAILEVPITTRFSGFFAAEFLIEGRMNMLMTEK